MEFFFYYHYYYCNILILLLFFDGRNGANEDTPETEFKMKGKKTQTLSKFLEKNLKHEINELFDKFRFV